MLVGGHGGVLGLGSVIPEMYVAIYAAALAGEWARANELQQRAIAALQMIFAASGRLADGDGHRRLQVRAARDGRHPLDHVSAALAAAVRS